MSLRLKDCGSEATRGALVSAFSGGHPPHAVLLEGTGAASHIAAELAQAAVCISEEDKPCGTCSGCVKALAGSHPDIMTVDGTADSKAFSVDVIRRIRSDAYIRPNEAPCKVYMLLGVQSMSEISQNALLKVLEEPPANVLFLLTASAASALLPTVRSRVQIFSVSGGELPADWTLAERAARAVCASGEAELLFASADFSANREVFRATLEQLLTLFRDALVARSGGSSTLSGRQDTAAVLSGALTRRNLLSMCEETEKTSAMLAGNGNLPLLAAAYCANLRAAAGK